MLIWHHRPWVCTQKAPKTPALPQSIFPPRDRAQGTARLLGVLVGTCSAWVPPGHHHLMWEGKGCSRAPPQQQQQRCRVRVSPQPWGSWGLSSAQPHCQTEALVKSTSLHSPPFIPAPASQILILWAQQELQAHLCLQHTPGITKSEWGHERSCPGQSHAEPPGEGP